MIKMNETDFLNAREDYAGYCEYCNAVTTDSGVEPDAEFYTCPNCDKDTLMGMEWAMLGGHIRIDVSRSLRDKSVRQ